MADYITKDQINCRNLKDSRSTPRPAGASVADADIVMELVAVCYNYRAGQGWRRKRAEF
jgi:hypothetical protein